MTVEEIRRRKKELGYSNQQLSERSGVPLGTVSKILSGVTERPRFETLRALETALREEAPETGRGRYGTESLSGPVQPLEVKETAKKYQTAGFTLDDYLNLPDEGPRKELIDGVFYDMGEPATAHQAIVGYIHKKLLDHVMEKGGPCMPMLSPVAVQLDEDDKTVVEPDVVVVCNRDKFQNRRIFGAPDFILEVLSPSTRKKDMWLKAFKYQNAGVREYWIIDPKARKLMVYDYEHEGFPAIYGFHEQVPVLIWNGECVIDLAEMVGFMGFLL